MKLKSESITLDGIEFTTTQFVALVGFKLELRLIKLIGPALLALASADPGANVLSALGSLGSELAGALASLDPSEAIQLAQEVLAGTTATLRDPTGGREVILATAENINLVFSGRLRTMHQVLMHAIKVNFGDFMPGSAPAAPTLQASG